MADIWRGASGIWTLAYESCLLGVETEGLCQRGAALETSVREKTGGWPRKNRKKRPGLGALMLSGLRKTLSILPSALAACLWVAILLWGAIQFIKPSA